MSARITVDSREWNRALIDVATATGRTQAEVLNQAALDVAGRAFDLIPPAEVGSNEKSGKRQEIREELTDVRSYVYRQVKAGPNKGKMKKVGSKWFTNPRSHGKDRTLRAIHLIVNAAMGRRGKKGLRGSDMRAYAGSVVGRRTRGVGFLKGVFIPIIRMLNPLVKYKFPTRKTRHIARWPGSAAHGIASPAKAGPNPIAMITTAPTVHGSKSDSKIMNMYQAAITEAIIWKTGKLKREAERAFQAIFDKHAGRSRF